MNQKFSRLIPKVVVFCILFVILVFGTACETPHYNIKVEYDNSEGEVTGAGIYPKGETVTVTAIPKKGFEFLNWTEENTVVLEEDHYSFEVSEDRILSANFAKTIQQFRVKFPFNLENMLRGSVEGGGVYEEGETVTVKATHNDGYGFVSWTEGNTILSRDSHYTFTITRDYNLKANFESETQYYTIRVSSNSSQGSVTGQGIYEKGSTATVKARANSGYEFKNWADGNTVVSRSSSYSFTVNGNRNLRANFEEKQSTCQYIGSKKSDVFHHLSCHYVSRILPENRICFTSREHAFSLGYRPCKHCKP